MSRSDEIRLLSTKWITFSALGLFLLSAGIVALMEAIMLRIGGKDLMTWGWVLIVAIVIINAGISFIGTSIKYRIYLDRRRKQDNEFQPGSGSSGSGDSSGRHKHRHHRSGSGSSRSKERSRKD